MKIFKIMTNEIEPKELGFYIIELVNENNNNDYVSKRYFFLEINRNGKKELLKITSIGTFVEFLDTFHYVSKEIFDDEFKKIYNELTSFLSADFSNIDDYDYQLSNEITAQDTFKNRLFNYYFGNKIINDQIDIKDYDLINKNIIK